MTELDAIRYRALAEGYLKQAQHHQECAADCLTKATSFFELVEKYEQGITVREPVIDCD